MNLISLFMAKKYLTFGKKDKNITFMIRMCFLGIFIGTFALMLTLIITNGFEKVIHEKMRGISSEAIIYAPGNKLDPLSIKKVLNDEFKNEISGFSSSSTRQVIIDHNKQQTVLFIKGVEPKTEHLVSSIGEKIVLPIIPDKTLEKVLVGENIIIGYKTAQQNKLKIGDHIRILIPEPSSKRKIFLTKKKARIAGIFKVGLDEYDNNFAYCSLDFLNKVFKEKKGVDQISISLKKNKKTNLFSKNNEKQILEKLQKRLTGLTVKSWKDLYPALVSSLKLEKYVMFFILALITLVACMNMISLLFMQIQQKRRDIAIFRAMGMAHRHIKRIFLTIGLSITFLGSISGLLLAALAGFMLEKYPFIELPDVYYVSYLPARMDLEIFIVVFICTIILGFVATWIPTKKARKINVVEVLRGE